MARVWLDAGHGGSDPGAVANNLKEKDINLIATLECKRILELHGITVGMTRSTDKYYSLSERCKLANNWKADRFISIHTNAGGGDGAEAIHSIYYGNGTEMAKAIVESIDEYTSQNLRPKATYSKSNSKGNADYFAVIRNTNMSSCIVEMAFIDSKDVEVIDTIDEQKAMGKAIAYGILKHLNITVKNEGEYYMKPYKNGSTQEIVYETNECVKQIGRLDPYEECQCIYEEDNRCVVLYKVYTGASKVGWVKYTGGIQK